MSFAEIPDDRKISNRQKWRVRTNSGCVFLFSKETRAFCSENAKENLNKTLIWRPASVTLRFDVEAI